MSLCYSLKHFCEQKINAGGNQCIFFKFIYLIYLFLSVLGLRCCARAFSSCSEQELLFIVVCRLLIAVASLVAEHVL